MLLLLALPPWPHHVDRGVLILVAALFLATILAHRYWRATIRLEDESAARITDLERASERYRQAFRAGTQAQAFVDRATGLVLEAAPGWAVRNLPETGEPLFALDPALEAVWRAIPAPDAEHRPAPALELTVVGRPFQAVPLGGASLGIVLVQEA
jgi:hypothetical protein